MKKSLVCTLLAASTAFCSGCQSTKPLTLEKNTALPFTLGHETREILYYASLAPNAHNSQPWLLHYNNNSLTLTFDTTRALPQTDPTHRESYLSLGAFLENLRQAATALGFRADIDITVTTGNEVAQIQLTPQPPANTHALALMEKRHTDKRPFADTPLAPEVVSALLERHKPYLTYYAKGSPEFQQLAENAVAAMQVQSAHQGKRDELARWLRFSNAEASAARDGLPAEQLGMTGIRKFFYYLFCDRDTARGDSFAKQSVTQTADQVAHCAGFFVISGAESAPDYVRAGMNLESFWLDAVAAGISLHPLSQILEEGPYELHLGLSQPPQMILRAGVLADYGQNNKIRRNLADFVLSAE